ncbi:hypothetical protein B0O99DRAFT_690500 [Bisporella sp. PMI_857]|nr:hypothetical protein B0O99DRAFT_690500 [Bisporella sp. PMI_857]
MESWDRYPSNLIEYYPNEDLEYYQDHLAQHAPRLFADKQLQVEFCSIGKEPKSQQKDKLCDPNHFAEVLQKHTGDNEEHIISFYQRNSWAPLLCSETIFRQIVSRYLVHPNFVDFLLCFGEKHDEKDEDMFGGYFCHLAKDDSLSGPNQCQKWSLHLIYNIRYVERTGRPDYAWAIRRMGIYQKYLSATGYSTWILLQPTKGACKIVENKADDLFPESRHITLLSALHRQWRPYLKDLDNSLRDLARIARFSGTKLNSKQVDFPVTFSDVQRLQHCREQLQDAILHLNHSLQILHGLRGLHSTIITSKDSSDNDLRVCISRVQMYRECAEKSLKWADDISNLITTLLSYRHDESFGQNNAKLREMAELAVKDSSNMLELTQETKKDSTTMRLIAIITMFYLPGTFVATIFSTIFVSLSTGQGVSSEAGKLGGIYAVVTAILMALTFGGAFWWRRRGERGYSTIP